MPTIRRTVTAAADDVLSGLKFKVQGSPALITLAATAASAGDTLSFSVGSQEFVAQAVINLEAADRVVDAERDIILQQEAVPAGEYYLAIPTVTGTDVTYLLIIEPVV